MNVHVPPATSSGVATKIATFEGLKQLLSQPTDRPRIVCGDFNTPKSESVSGQVVFWGDQRQVQAERDIILGLPEVGLADAFRSLHGYGEKAVSWRASNGTGRRYDHVFAAAELPASDARYEDLDQIAAQRLGDHAPLCVVFDDLSTKSAAPQRGVTEGPRMAPSEPRAVLRKGPAMEPDGHESLRSFLTSLDFLHDVRQSPDDARRGQFFRGWRRAVTGPAYARSTLRRLTWNNLGYRAGMEFGPASQERIDEAFESLARIYSVDGPLRS